jgi:hypothetical protein
MSALHQMGNDTENLIDDVEGYSGAIASPVNDSPETVRGQVDRLQRADFPIALDPQLYFPRSERGQLRQWPYFPAEIDTADLSSEGWWSAVAVNVLKVAKDLGVQIVCSPAAVPIQYSNEYYRLMTTVAAALASAGDRRVLQTVLVRLPDMAVKDRAREIASIVSDTKAAGLYVVILSDLVPRLEYQATEEIKGAMLLVREISRARLPVTIGFCGSEVVLWKEAGTADCATGKFFNLRRFTPGRFEDPNKGGGQVAYWFEEALMASVRESDLVRLRNIGLLSAASLSNPHSQAILNRLDSEPGKAWVGLGWRQYMHWFADVERRIREGLNVDTLLANAELNWQALQDSKVLMEEPRNDGRWLRPWRRAIAEYANE